MRKERLENSKEVQEKDGKLIWNARLYLNYQKQEDTEMLHLGK